MTGMSVQMWLSTERRSWIKFKHTNGKSFSISWFKVTDGLMYRRMSTYDDVTLERIFPTQLGPGESELILLYQDECIFNVNEGPRRRWLQSGQQPLKKKGNGRAIHISGWICETSGHLRLSEEQIEAQKSLPKDLQLTVTESRKIIYPGKNHDAWWDLAQLMEQLEHAVEIFEHLNPGKTGVWMFDCSAAHEGFAKDALNVSNMNIRPGGVQHHL